MLKAFNYHRPDNLNEACQLFTELPDAQILAGGTDLLVDIETGVRQARHVISINRLSELVQIKKTDRGISIGAACTARDLEKSPIIRRYYPEISEMIDSFASPQIRNRATVGGNICSAVACGDFPVILIALHAKIELFSRMKTRIIPLKDFFIHNRKTIGEKGEILSSIHLPTKPPSSAASFLKYQRRASNALAVASVASFLNIHNGICREARIVLGAVAPRPLLAKNASKSLEGQGVNEKAISYAAELSRREAKPISDVRGTEDFRRKLVYVLTKRGIKQVVEKIERTD